MKNNIWYDRYLVLKDRIKRKKNKLLYFNQLKKIKVKNTDETLDRILNGNYSVLRLGDGELNLIFGENLKFQNYNESLERELREVLIDNNKELLVCLPDIFNELDIYTEKAKKFWLEYLERKINKILKVIDMEKVYYDTQISRFYIDVSNKKKVKERIDKIKKIWQGQEIIFVEGEKSRLGVGNDLFKNAQKIERILCPSHQAYSIIDKIEKRVLKENKNKLIFLALGPTATVLGYRLFKKGYRVLDIGHIDIEYEWYLKGVQEKIAIDKKYIGEVSSLEAIEEYRDKEYEEQILDKILN